MSGDYDDDAISGLHAKMRSQAKQLTAAQQRIAELEIALRDVLGFLRTACEDPEWVSSAHSEARDYEQILRAGQGGGDAS